MAELAQVCGEKARVTGRSPPRSPCSGVAWELRGHPAPSSGMCETLPTETQHPEVLLGASHGHSLPGMQPSSRHLPPPPYPPGFSKPHRGHRRSWHQEPFGTGGGGDPPQIRAPRDQSGQPCQQGFVRSRSACRAPAPAPWVTSFAWFF